MCYPVAAVLKESLLYSAHKSSGPSLFYTTKNAQLDPEYPTTANNTVYIMEG